MIKKKELIKINKCRSCKSKKLNQVLSLGNQYLSDFFSTNKKPKRFPLELVLCGECSLLQLLHNVAPNILYHERYGYKSGLNQTMKDELKDVVLKSSKHIGKAGKFYVIDIGANDGTLLSNYPKSVTRIAVEPIKKFANILESNSDIVVNDFFNFKAVNKKGPDVKARIITAISCFYDIEDPNLFISDSVRLLHEDGILVIQQNYLGQMIENNAFDNIVHEHLEYYSLLSMENLLKKHNLEIFHVELRSVNGGSFRTYIDFKGKRKINKSVISLRSKEKKMNLSSKKSYIDFALRVKEVGDQLKNTIDELVKNKKTVYIYGASTRGNTLLQYCKLNQSLIHAAVERNPEKWGRKISSVGIPIISEEQARKEKPDYMLVLPWFFKEEFLKRESKFLKSGGHFIFPLPKVEIL